ncbi:uncharacterized protein LOC124923725 [Impatiens glandulifera]|uniref:uncharacterized protein LOC124923725 n=1 Tax=Impatiens glandulifera TaxID=253017 RepID=UPI001FB10EE9|nr:uncharacterized protein LOC124923725 [Impatiens glandulifera]
MMMKKKKKGRPSFLDLQKRALEQEKKLQRQPLISSKPNFNTLNPRSTRRNINPEANSSASDEIDAVGEKEDHDDDDDDERTAKKVKLVVRLPPSSDHQHFNLPKSSANSLSLISASADHESCPEGDNHETSTKKLKINAGGGRSGSLHATDQDKKFKKATDALHGNGREVCPRTSLPDKKLLIYILDRLQKKDTHEVFSEPVDSDELPDYHEIIEHPMDFGTVRKKLGDGNYTKLEDFEADIFLICSNAMKYNAPDTVYFRQARSIQELAKRDFENLREVNEEGEPQPKIVRRGRPPTKNLKKEFTSPPSARFRPESLSDATPASMGEDQNSPISNNYNLRKGPMSYKFRHNDVYTGSSHLFGSNDSFHDWPSDWNTEFPASVLKAEAKHVKKTFSIDENRRSTYKLSQSSTLVHDPYLLTSLNGQINRLMGVGVTVEHGYTRSLARFAGNLGPLAWKIASKKIESVLPSGVKFGPGWVGECEEESVQQITAVLSEQMSPNNNNITSSGIVVNHKITDSSGSFQKHLHSTSMERQYSLQDVKPVFHGPGSPSSGLQSGSSMQQPDLVLQL